MGKTNARLDRQFGRVVSGLARPWRLRPTEQQCTFFNPRWGAKTICVKPFVLQCVPTGAMSDWRLKSTWFQPRRPIAIVTSWRKDGNVECREWKRSKKWLRDDETIDLRQQRMMYHIIGLCHARFSCHQWAPLPQSLRKSTSCSTARCQMHRNPTGIHIPELSFARKVPERSTCFKPNVQTHPE